jgi:hypothetical protein
VTFKGLLLWKLRRKNARDGPSSSVFVAVPDVGDNGAYGLASLSVSLPVKRAFWPPHTMKRDMVGPGKLGEDRRHGIPAEKQSHVKHLDTRSGVTIFDNLKSHSQVN